MSDEAAFLSAITKTPDDDTVRLVYADWLQERTDPRAEYLRSEVERHRTAPRQKPTGDSVRALERLRPHATPEWLSRIDRTIRYSIYWPQDSCERAERDKLVGQPLARVHTRGNSKTRFPKIVERGDYLYVFAFRDRTLFLVGRMRIDRPMEEQTGSWSSLLGFAGTEGTPVRLDRAVPAAEVARLSWYSGRMEERRLNLDADGQMLSHESLNKVRRLTPSTAADLDAILRGDSHS